MSVAFKSPLNSLPLDRSRSMSPRTLRLLPSLLAMLRALPAALEVLYLEWALREIHPLHPDVPLIVARINELEQE